MIRKWIHWLSHLLGLHSVDYIGEDRMKCKICGKIEFLK